MKGMIKMIVNPEKICFETTDDVIDYVSAGLPPTKKNFEKVITKVKKPDTYLGDAYYRNAPRAGIEVIIDESVINPSDRNAIDYTLRRVYKNRIRNRNTALIASGVIGLGILGFIFNGKNSSNEPDEINEF